MIFDADSTAVLKMLSEAADSPDENAAFWFAIGGANAFLEDFELPVPNRITLLQGLRDDLSRRLQLPAASRTRVNRRFRRDRQALTDFLNALSDPRFEGLRSSVSDLNLDLRRMVLVQTALKERSNVIRDICSQLRVATANWPREKYHLAASYIHMHINRMLATKRQTDELMIYEYLVRHYLSLLGRITAENSAAAQGSQGEIYV
jgi:lantibiotic biosynthesis protein